MQATKVLQIPIARLPIFWLFFGPPIFRVVGRPGQASVDGSFDIWNLIRVGWWLVFGLIAVLEIYRHRAHLPNFIRSLGFFPWWVGLWLIMLFTSTLFTPSPILTVASATMMAILVLASLDLGLKLYIGVIDIQRALKICFGFALVLLMTFIVLYFLWPDMVGKRGMRARGGMVVDIALVSQVLFFIGIYLASLSWGLTKKFFRLVVLISPIFLLIAQTRAMYISFFIGCSFFVWQWLSILKVHHQRRLLTMLCLAASGIAAIALYDEVSWSSNTLSGVEEYLVRDQESLQNFSGRDEVALALIDAVAAQPLGLGYAAGTRAFLYNAHHVPFASSMGNAHNMYLEILAGTGFLGGAAWLALLLWLLFRAWRIRSKEVIPIRILLLVVLIGGLTESAGALPFYQPASLLWILAAFITALPQAVSARASQISPLSQVARAYRHS